MIRFRWSEVADGLFGPLSLAFSPDHGRTWEEGPVWPAGDKRAAGTTRECWAAPVAVGDHLLLLGAAGVFPRDQAQDALAYSAPRYKVSGDGGRTWDLDEPAVQAEAGFDEDHPFPEVWIGRNTVLPGHAPLVLKDGRVLAPCTVSMPDSAESSSAAVLEGRWEGDGRLSWRLLNRVGIKPAQSRRGALDPTLAEMPDGRLLMVIQADAGSADPNAGYAWFSISGDGGRNWGRPWPWTFADGSPFFSPCSRSRLFRHSSGDWYWIGNVCPEPPQGDNPRYPLVIGRVDPLTLRLQMETLDVIDTRSDEDSEQVDLSCFSLYEDRRTGDMVLRMTRRDGGPGGQAPLRAPVMAYTFDL
jgi:hypothetical protein